jgi:hypothetical protein
VNKAHVASVAQNHLELEQAHQHDSLFMILANFFFEKRTYLLRRWLPVRDALRPI